MLLNSGVREDSWESAGLQGDQTSQSQMKSGLMRKLKLQYFGHLMGRTDSMERPWCWERLKARGEKANRGWDGWMASLTWWTWVWASSRSWWWTGKSGVRQSMGPQRVGYDWATERQRLATNGLQSIGLQRVWHNLAARQQQQQSLYKDDSKLSALKQ